MKKSSILLLVILTSASATRFWEHADFERADTVLRSAPVLQTHVGRLPAEWQRWSYIRELCQTVGFIASMQVSDPGDPEYGGLIEGEDAMTIVETDNTQEAIWVWCRHYEITGDTTYFENIRRAWIYVMNHPAWTEEGATSDYYRVWNCGLGLFAESKYRNTFGDSTYLPYADTCIQYMFAHPLSFTHPDPYYARLHPKTTSLAAGMLYQYGKDLNMQEYKDTALAYGNRVRLWIEANPQNNINDEVWAMSGGTAVWGLCRSLFDADTTAGVAWLNTYLPYMKYYQPTGTWNNSWNIWYANAYNHAARITQNGTYVEYHHSITDSLLIQDYDEDGGVPPTRTWGQNQDHSWISAYMCFMGFEGLMDSIKNIDAGINDLYAVGPEAYFLVGDSLILFVNALNYGFDSLWDVYISFTGPFLADTTIDLAVGQEQPIEFAQSWVPSDTGWVDLSAYSLYGGDERSENDTFQTAIYIRPLRLVAGSVLDSSSGEGIAATVYFQFIDAAGTTYFDSAATDSVTGAFSVYLIDSLYRAYVFTEIPYPDFIEEYIYVTPDSVSDLDFALKPADILVVNRDNEGRFAEYFTESLDSLNKTYKVWTPVEQGIFPTSRISEFNDTVIIWYSGNAETNTVTAPEQESLMVYLDSGGKLIITGQNIGEEIQASQFYTDYLHAQLVNDSVQSLYVYPDNSDSLGQNIGTMFTSGGVANQYSRDQIAADTFAHQFLFYDDALTQCAGIWYNSPSSGYQTIYCGFGIEAVHHRPGYMHREQLLAAFLRWFGVLSVEEYGTQHMAPLFAIFPNPSRQLIRVTLAPALWFENGSISVYDASGRLVRRLITEHPLHDVSWNSRDAQNRQVPAGVYFVHLQCGKHIRVAKAVIVR